MQCFVLQILGSDSDTIYRKGVQPRFNADCLKQIEVVLAPSAARQTVGIKSF